MKSFKFIWTHFIIIIIINSHFKLCIKFKLNEYIYLNL